MDRNNLFLTSSAWLMRHLYSSTYVCKYCSFSLIIPTATFLHFFAWFINISCALYTDSLRDLSKILCLKNSNCFSLLTQEKANFDFTLWVKTYCSWIFPMAPSTSSFLIFIDCMWLKNIPQNIYISDSNYAEILRKQINYLAFSSFQGILPLSESGEKLRPDSHDIPSVLTQHPHSVFPL